VVLCSIMKAGYHTISVGCVRCSSQTSQQGNWCSLYVLEHGAFLVLYPPLPSHSLAPAAAAAAVLHDLPPAAGVSVLSGVRYTAPLRLYLLVVQCLAGWLAKLPLLLLVAWHTVSTATPHTYSLPNLFACTTY